MNTRSRTMAHGSRCVGEDGNLSLGAVCHVNRGSEPWKLIRPDKHLHLDAILRTKGRKGGKEELPGMRMAAAALHLYLVLSRAEQKNEQKTKQLRGRNKTERASPVGEHGKVNIKERRGTGCSM